MEQQAIYVTSAHGILTVDYMTGETVEVDLADDFEWNEPTVLKWRWDLAKFKHWLQAHGATLSPGESVDVLFLGHWDENKKYFGPEEDALKDYAAERLDQGTFTISGAYGETVLDVATGLAKETTKLSALGRILRADVEDFKKLNGRDVQADDGFGTPKIGVWILEYGKVVYKPAMERYVDVFTVESDHGTLTVNIETGQILEVELSEGSEWDFSDIIAFDIWEYEKWYKEPIEPGEEIDIIRIGCWYKETTGKKMYMPPVKHHRGGPWPGEPGWKEEV